jgi:hypothetical protein
MHDGRYYTIGEHGYTRVSEGRGGGLWVRNQKEREKRGQNRFCAWRIVNVGCDESDDKPECALQRLKPDRQPGSMPNSFSIADIFAIETFRSLSLNSSSSSEHR